MMRFLPNILTVFRILLTPLFVFCLLEDDMQSYAILIFALAAVTDWYDGFIARRYQLTTDTGRFLDPLADKILVLSAFFSFVYLGLIKLWMVLIIVVRDFVVTGMRSYALRIGRPMSTNEFGKLKTASQMFMIVLILVFLAIQSSLESMTMAVGTILKDWFVTIPHYQIIYNGMLLVTALTFASGILYLYQNRQNLRRLMGFQFRDS